MDSYLWLKALHVISFTAWMAGLFYLPRLYVYHSGVAVGSEASELFKVMERRLLRAITTPAMIATFLFGGALLWQGGGGSWAGLRDWLASAPWLHAKLTLVFLLAGVHGWLASIRKKFLRDLRPYSALTFRIMNEVPTALFVAIVFLALLKPI